MWLSSHFTIKKVMSPTRNINCGVLGHVDSGKTALCRALHRVASTASMDKNPQSRERGMTLDMGFSSFLLQRWGDPGEEFEVTLVDCPGHASLIRTVLGASQIIDLGILVVDARRGFQAQTGECIVIAEIVIPKLLIVINKIDSIPPDDRSQILARLETNIRKAMSKTLFGGDLPIVHVSALTGDGLGALASAMSRILLNPPSRDSTGPLHIAFDHCFSVRGQGTVFTGTVLSGVARRGQKVFLPEWNETGEIRSIQKFRIPSDMAGQGDRVGLCVPGISPEGKERGDIYDTSTNVTRWTSMVFSVKNIKYFKGNYAGNKFHVSIGHSHSMATPYFFRATSGSSKNEFESFPGVTGPGGCLGSGPLLQALIPQWNRAQEQVDDANVTFELVIDLVSSAFDEGELLCWMQFDNPIRCQRNPLMIASKLDLDTDYTGCRLAFYGRGLSVDQQALLKRIIKKKRKVGFVDRIQSDGTLIVRGLLNTTASDPGALIGLPVVHTKSGVCGTVVAPFGKSGLLRISLYVHEETTIGDEVILDRTKPALAKIIQPDWL